MLARRGKRLNMGMGRYAVKPRHSERGQRPLKDNLKVPHSIPLKEGTLPTKDNLKVHTPYKITSERGQPLYKGHKGGRVLSMSIIQSVY